MNRVATFVLIKLNRQRGRCTTLEWCENGIKKTTPSSDSAVLALARAFYCQRLLNEGRVNSAYPR